MKKFFIALSVLAALMLSVVPSQAIMGVPDVDALGTDAIVPFITDLDWEGRTGLNTLFVFTDVMGAQSSTALPGMRFHWTLYTVASKTMIDDDVAGTEYDILPLDAYTMIAGMSATGASARSLLEVDLDGDGTNDHYAGYLWFDNNSQVKNTVGGQMLFVNLAQGLVGSANIPMKEYKDDLQSTIGAYMVNDAPALDYVEVFSPAALKGADLLQEGATTWTAPATFGIYPRYYIPASGDATWLIYWMSSNALVGTNQYIPDPIHGFWYDNEENKVSHNISIPNELTVIDVGPRIPNTLFPSATYPKEGWIDINWPVTNTTTAAIEVLGWTWMQAYGVSGSQNLSWGALNPMWRAVDRP
jgi:hypothetical protein